jgi:hypothetical protein
VVTGPELKKPGQLVKSFFVAGPGFFPPAHFGLNISNYPANAKTNYGYFFV